MVKSIYIGVIPRILVFLALFMLFSSCSKNKSNNWDNEINMDYWDYKKGYIAYKEEHRILVTRKKISILEDMTLQEIIAAVRPNAIWVRVEDRNKYNSFNINDNIEIWYVDGLIDQSYPAQGTAERVKVLK